jgi:hypothetical protein
MPIANKRGRMGRVNPGRRHISGDIPMKYQRMYEHVLASARERGEYPGREKEVAARTVRKYLSQHNPESLAEATRIAEDFHGRMARGDFDVTETEIYDEFGGVLGYLSKLGILDPDGKNQNPISWPYDPDVPEENILVVATDENNIEYIGGDQRFDWQNVPGSSTSELKNLVFIGDVWEIEYWADKHHLSGPKSQKQGIIYYHTFGEEGGDLPYLVYDTRNAKLLFVGGDYRITPEGIAG